METRVGNVVYVCLCVITFVDEREEIGIIDLPEIEVEFALAT
jgi:hypothetical protein